MSGEVQRVLGGRGDGAPGRCWFEVRRWKHHGVAHDQRVAENTAGVEHGEGLQNNVEKCWFALPVCVKAVRWIFVTILKGPVCNKSSVLNYKMNVIISYIMQTFSTETLAPLTTMLQPVNSPFKISVPEQNVCLCFGLCDSALLTPWVARKEHEHSLQPPLKVSKQTGPTEIMFESTQPKKPRHPSKHWRCIWKMETAKSTEEF